MIFDIVLNMENIYSIGTIEEEMRLAVSYYRALGQDYNVVNEHFEVTDEVKDFIPLFEKLNETLTASWDFMYAEAKKYYEENGNLEISKRYKTESGYSLGSRIDRQRRNEKLSADRREKLNRLGMVWKKEGSWDVRYRLAAEYYEKNGNLDIKTNYVADGIWLGKWLAEQRKSYRDGTLPRDCARRLGALGVTWLNAVQGVGSRHLEYVNII